MENQLDREAKEHGKKNERSSGKDRRLKERRKPKRGVNIRHDDEHYIPKRIRK